MAVIRQKDNDSSENHLFEQIFPIATVCHIYQYAFFLFHFLIMPYTKTKHIFATRLYPCAFVTYVSIYMECIICC